MRFVFFVLIVLLTIPVKSQEFSKEEQYKQALQNAKTAFEAKQYSQAVMFYHEAQKIKPEALLPRYKIEDIRTIYIEKEQVASKSESKPETKKEKKLSKKEKLILQKQEEEKLKQKATAKMEQEAELVKKEMNSLKVADVKIEEDKVITDSVLTKNEPLTVIREPALNPIEIKKQDLTEGENNEPSDKVIILEKKEVVSDIPVQKKEADPAKVEKVVVKTDGPKQNQNANNKVKQAVSKEEKKVWIEQEKQRLAITYPNKKTVEESDKPGKYITRVIMNIDNKVTIYLKVQHSWGATFFFIDEVGQDLRSITEQYFNLMTNLNTYGD